MVKYLIALVLLLACASMAEAGHGNRGNFNAGFQAGQRQAQRDFNQGFRAGQNFGNGGCNYGGTFGAGGCNNNRGNRGNRGNGGGGGNVQFGLFNFSR